MMWSISEKLRKPMHACRSGSLHQTSHLLHTKDTKDIFNTWNDMSTSNALRLYSCTKANVKVHIHNVNDRGYHKMWSPASSTRTMTNISYYTIQYWNSNDNKLLARCDLLWKKKYYVWSQDVSNVIILQIDGNRLKTVQDVSQIPISIEWAVLAHQCGSNMILTTTSMMCRGSRLQDVISAWLSVEA